MCQSFQKPKTPEIEMADQNRVEEDEYDSSTVYDIRASTILKSNYYLKWSTYYVMLIVSLPFVFLIPQYSHQFRVGVKESWMDGFYSVFASNPDYFSGQGSITNEQFEFYSKYNWPIALHTIGGPAWLFFGFIQFNNYIRDNYIKIHRISGYAYFISLTISLIGSGSMLTLHLTEATTNADLSLVWTENAAYHIYLVFYWAAGVITGIFYKT